MTDRNRSWIAVRRGLIATVAVALGLLFAERHSYLLFHSLAELFSVVIGVSIFTIAWNSQRFQRDSYLLYLGVAFLFVAGLDLVHMLSYKGMGVVKHDEANHATQVWIAARYLESISLAAATWFIGRKVRPALLLTGTGSVFALLVATIFVWHIFPICLVELPEGARLTVFKVVSEYVICTILVVAIVGQFKHRHRLDQGVVRLLVAAMAVTILQELAFTLYQDVYGALNLVGHCLKILAFFLIYKAIVETGLSRPYELLFFDLKQRENALRESEERFRSFMAHSPAAGWIVDMEGRFRYVSAGYYAMFGTGHADLTGKTIAEIYSPELAQDYIDNNLKAIRDGRALETVESGVRSDGSPGQFLVVKFPMQTANVEILLGGMALDITARQAEQAALKAARTSAERAKAEAERANAAKDRFIATLSHELRTPLTPAVVAASSLAQDPRLPEDLRHEAEIIRRNIGLEVALINDLLDVTRVANGKLSLHREPVDLAEIVRDAISICRTDLEEKRQVLTVNMPGAPYHLDADSPRLHQVLWNLLRNAIKFTPEGGQIAIMASAHAGHITVSVTDTGIGIAPEVLPSLFAAFEQGDRGRSFGGLGLGLAIARGVVELHGGKISASSEGPGKGSTFTVTLPLRHTPASPPPPRVPPIASSTTPAIQRKLRILLVEDHLDTARIMARLLSADGHTVSRVDTIQAALAAISSGEFDLLMSDLGLPDGSGQDLVRQLRAAGRSLPAIALSGYGAADDVQRSLDAGFSEHLTKPVSFELLRSVLGRVASRT